MLGNVKLQELRNSETLSMQELLGEKTDRVKLENRSIHDKKRANRQIATESHC